jgi:iron complex transport system ATP-binding protein
MLKATNLSIMRGRRRVLSDVSLTFKPGQLTVIAGPNGAGKSTLIKALSGELAPGEGSVTLDGTPLAKLPAGIFAARRAVVPQATVLSFPFTVLEVVRLGSSVPGFGSVGEDATATAALAAVDLSALRHRYYTELSGGERQRVHFARALCQLMAARTDRQHSTLLLLDEPTSNLDLAHQMLLLGRAQDEARAGRIVVAVLHDLNLAATWAGQIVLLADGIVAAQGEPRAVFDNKLLSALYSQQVRANTTPADGRPFVLPQAMDRNAGRETSLAAVLRTP